MKILNSTRIELHRGCNVHIDCGKAIKRLCKCQVTALLLLTIRILSYLDRICICPCIIFKNGNRNNHLYGNQTTLVVF